MSGDTIIGFPFESEALQPLIVDQAASQAMSRAEEMRRLMKIRAADSEGRRSSASILIDRMYATRGYHTKPLEDVPDRITLTASDHDNIVGTISVGFDSASGLMCDDLYLDEINQFRACGWHVCEFTKLAMDNVVRSKRVLASLFHVAYIYAHRIKGYHKLLIEVNPRHVRYYERMLGFTVTGPLRMNRRVSAPAVLMTLDLFHARDEIRRFGGHPELAETERSLYPLFFSAAEETGIVGRLQRTDTAGMPLGATQ